MKKILITGANSYIGSSFEKWMQQWPDYYTIDVVDMIDGTWKDKDFSLFDIVFHVAGIAHQKEKKEMKDIYYNVNCTLVEEVALKAKASGVKQFIFMSSMSVYGLTTGIIIAKTQLNPKTFYGWSKMLAEEKITPLVDDNFVVAIIRAPMIYGRGCKGNYSILSKYAEKLPVFPDVDNKRSMLYIDNLSSFLKKLIDNKSGGIFFPQNKEYVCTSNLVKEISRIHGKNIKLTRVFNSIIKRIQIGVVKKVFGSLVYEKVDLCEEVSFIQSIIDTEK
jgi:UDP-glucose 4-epimerase